MKLIPIFALFGFLWFANRSSDAFGSTKIYVTNSQGDDITVIDLATRRATADIKVGEGVHGICAPADGRTVFVTVESEHNLKIIDTTTNAVVKSIPLTGRPNQCASTPDGHYVAVPIRDRDSVDIVDMKEKKVVKALPVRIPHNSYNSGSIQQMFVSSMGDHEIDIIERWPM